MRPKGESVGPKRGEGSGLWLVKVLTGLLVVIVLGLHLVVNHLVAANGLLNWQDVVNYYNNPLIVWLEGFFLLAVLTHAALGVRSILLDLNISHQKQRFLDLTLALIGGSLFIYGAWILIKVSRF